MSKIGVSLKINVKALDKARFFHGKQGVYADLTVFIDTDNPDQWGNHGVITEALSKEERGAGMQSNIIGNAKVFWGNQGSFQRPVQQAYDVTQQPPVQQQVQQQAPAQRPVQQGNPQSQPIDFDGDIPF